MFLSFFFTDTPTTDIYTYLHTLPLHDARPICPTERTVGPDDTLAPVARRLSELLGQPVTLVAGWVDGVKPELGQVLMLENCRCNVGEKKNDQELSRKMAALCDVYVNDAFCTAHRAEATTHGIAQFASVA